MTNGQVTGNVHGAVVTGESTTGDNYIRGSQRATGVIGPGAVSRYADVAADAHLSARHVNNAGSRHTAAEWRRIGGKGSGTA